MFLFRSRWVVGALILALLIVTGSYFGGQWWYSRDDFHHESTEVEDKKRSSKADTSAPAVDAPTPEVDAATPADEPLAPVDESPAPVDESSVPVDSSPQMAEADGELDSKDSAKVSPFGFGPYPEVPEGYGPVTWPRSSPGHELMVRVQVKLWKQGINVVGLRRDGRTGLIYPNIPGVVYIEWAENPQPDGSVLRYAARCSGPPETVQAIRNQAHNNKGLPFPSLITESDIPAGIQVISLPEGGIDPYEFLELKKE